MRVDTIELLLVPKRLKATLLILVDPDSFHLEPRGLTEPSRLSISMSR